MVESNVDADCSIDDMTDAAKAKAVLFVQSFDSIPDTTAIEVDQACENENGFQAWQSLLKVLGIAQPVAQDTVC